MKKALLLIAGAAVVMVAAGFAVLYAGLYDIAATHQHLQSTYWLLDTGMRESVRRRARHIDVPPLGDEQQLAQGLAGFRRHCVACHGAPGVAPQPFALGMAPAPVNLVYSAREWTPAQLFWVIKFGIKMSGMPAWQFRLHDEQIWAIVAFMQRLPLLSPRDYAALSANDVPQHPDAAATGSGDAERGRLAMSQYGCATCHSIPGIVGAHAPVGPPLGGVAGRSLIAGRWPNTPQHMERWLRSPQELKPGSAMPTLGVSAADARDMAAYLATLE